MSNDFRGANDEDINNEQILITSKLIQSD